MSVGNPLLAFGAILKKTLEDDTIKEYQCKDCGYIWRYGDPAEDTPIISDDQEHTQERVLLVLFGFTDLGEIDDSLLLGKDLHITGEKIQQLIDSLNSEFDIHLPRHSVEDSLTVKDLVQLVNNVLTGNDVGILLSNNEKEYLDIFRDYSAEGAISERDRKMLDKFRSRLGISEERARELEEYCSELELTNDEQVYLEMYKVYAVDGEISEQDRKMLDKLRDRMDISEERAKEIEQLLQNNQPPTET